MLGPVAHYVMSEKAEGRSDRAIVVIDPSADLTEQAPFRCLVGLRE